MGTSIHHPPYRWHTHRYTPWTPHAEANVKELLLADANRLSASHAEYEATRQQIERAEYKTFTLCESDFDDLVFMDWKKYNGTF